jgi:RNA polymerase sigma factor (sigma-70 family)
MAEVPFFRALTAAVADAAAPDAELLRRFAEANDGPAFELLVRRHAGLVWKVCRAVHPADAHAAEDAFQAAFLALARRAGSIREPSAAGWLFRVARHAAHRARTKAASRRAEPLPEDVPAAAGPDPAECAEVATILNEEVARLSAKFREPVLLCFFEGCSHAEAAERLGWAVGTVASRLARAKDRLRHRLTRRGVAPALAGLGAASASQAPASAVRGAVTLALGPPGAVPPSIQSLSQGALTAMSSSKSKVFAALAAGLMLAAGATTVAALTGPADDPPKKTAPPPAAKAPAAADDPAEKELKAFAGTWKVVRIANDRGEAPPAVLEKMCWVVTGDEVVGTDDGQTQGGKFKVKVAQDKAPKEIDLTSDGKTMQGIYKLEDGTWTVCVRDVNAADKGRPKKFAAGPDTGLIVLARTGAAAELRETLDGVWRPTRVEAPGKDLLKLKHTRLVISRDVVWLIDTSEGHDTALRMSLRVWPERPGEIDLVNEYGPPDQRGRVAPGLYALKDGKLTLCYPPFGSSEKGRPAELKAADGVAFLELERVPAR